VLKRKEGIGVGAGAVVLEEGGRCSLEVFVRLTRCGGALAAGVLRAGVAGSRDLSDSSDCGGWRQQSIATELGDGGDPPTSNFRATVPLNSWLTSVPCREHHRPR
jgi:hypothetical protein